MTQSMLLTGIIVQACWHGHSSRDLQGPCSGNQWQILLPCRAGQHGLILAEHALLWEPQALFVRVI